MSKHLLAATKTNFVQWFNNQPDIIKYQLMIAPFHGSTELARFRRLYIRTLNNVNHRQLRGRL